ncbi:hypothetical protein PIB30_089632 [Stylosanthes scabra]|uniref:Uncharacterized protein n=1 Tax=Stylosanthes scabra TaxID=79078 RepID=A0ABU6QTI5_9FABA|nr:hypothetical protein [Stylosanthes scabra]
MTKRQEIKFMFQLIMMLMNDDQLELFEDPPGFHPRRSTRERRPSTRYLPSEYVTYTDGYVTLNDEGEPECFEETMEGEDEMAGEDDATHHGKRQQLVEETTPFTSFFKKLAGFQFDSTIRFQAGSSVLKWFANFRFHILNRAGESVDSRSNRFNRPVRFNF